MMKFRKKPVVIEAFRLGFDIIPDWASNETGIVYGSHFADIPTLEGTMRASLGDWIIKGVKGEQYPCKDEIFMATYEPVEEQS